MKQDIPCSDEPRVTRIPLFWISTFHILFRNLNFFCLIFSSADHSPPYQLIIVIVAFNLVVVFGLCHACPNFFLLKIITFVLHFFTCNFPFRWNLHQLTLRSLIKLLLFGFAYQCLCDLFFLQVDRHPQFRHSRCLFVVRTDGGWIDFSYQKCLREYIKKKYPAHAERFIREHLKRGSSWCMYSGIIYFDMQVFDIVTTLHIYSPCPTVFRWLTHVVNCSR